MRVHSPSEFTHVRRAQAADLPWNGQRQRFLEGRHLPPNIVHFTQFFAGVISSRLVPKKGQNHHGKLGKEIRAEAPIWNY